ncbi:MAG: hypothetical protein OEW75_05615 [Cyclobacteriaceae bacterium]|nr:hypothetical protein [Cyclobacteriaceae bacterium]
MASILPNYHYDIFISYRQKDNLTSTGNGWVTEFVQALKNELEAAFKEEISVYFDVNPHDGLQDTHDVDESLKEKVQCLIFIPIVSRTYCDPNSFAWAKELLPFLDFAKNDEFGLKVKVANGNVASRVLPVRIHDLDKGDVALFEEVTTGVLRSVDFVYKGSGVNRPLREKDDDQLYLDQVNKLANSIREIFDSLKEPIVTKKVAPSSKRKNQSDRHHTGNKIKLMKVLIPALIVTLVSLGLYFFLPEKNSSPRVEIDKALERSIAIMPIVDLTPGKEHEWLSEGISEALINHLGNIEDIEVRGKTSSFAFRNETLTIRQYADTLHVNYVLEGSLIQQNAEYRISIRLIEAVHDKTIWSDYIDFTLDDIFKVQSEIANYVTKSLEIHLNAEAREIMFGTGSKNVKAYENYMKGKQLFDKAHNYNDDKKNILNLLEEANKWFNLALEEDPHYGLASYFSSDYYSHSPDKEDNEVGIQIIQRSVEIEENPDMKLFFNIRLKLKSGDWKGLESMIDTHIANKAPHLGLDDVNGMFFLYYLKGLDFSIDYCRQSYQYDPTQSVTKRWLWVLYIKSGQFEKASEIFNEMSRFKDYAEIWSGLIKKEFSYDSIDYFFPERRVFRTDIDSINSFNNPFILLSYVNNLWQHQEKNRANQIIHRFDSTASNLDLVNLQVAISNNLLFLPFNIDAAPNFKKRLEEAGIDSEDLETMPVFSNK